MIEVRIAPKWWGLKSRGAEEALIFGVGHLAGGEQICIHPDAVHRLLVVLTRVASHEEPACRNSNERGNKFAGSRLRRKCCHRSDQSARRARATSSILFS